MRISDWSSDVCSSDLLTLVLGNDLDSDRWCVGNGGVRHDLPEGQFIGSGSLVTYFDSPAMMNKALNDEDLKIKITLTRGDGSGTAGNEQQIGRASCRERVCQNV